MLTLAIETATITAGMAILQEEEVIAEFYVNLGRHHAEVLLPALDRLFLLAGLTPDQVDLFACTVGPGSFTGVRIGVSTVKGLALAMGKPVVGTSTLEVLAMNASLCPNLICPLLDARKGQVYAGFFRMGKDGLSEAVKPERLSDVEILLQDLVDEEVVFLGDGAVRYGKLICETLPGGFVPVDGRLHRLRASAVGLTGLRKYRSGGFLDVLTLAPKYLRLSEAETKYRTA
ncbi:MAG: tRNA (adenosine(37)-N6)-threonylcarbamoyltransferase complex dimerization subunit type 1 TsaB [Proteobacteria bacterium]|nr:tRNA (adenosine(37)-N6)-threonylcarbamoyltransferase complex dimerization subunit type 1 TsaB [Pseudomonadota bacterium]MBU2228503.1 tRNA (adenosine(37)-N6)-threonylcarbamoyltransferase complex dimerization subunit type 1 TsaB [Pseudomonadota bacterium]MBU2260891.1 tRNA (adenosine(37)-N6)-threonylcarbamoyltransferase complex dimerization subunit type 1 TsaB [Pseudomonadota bacterium]